MPPNTPLTSSRTRIRVAPPASRRRTTRRVLAGLGVTILTWGCDSGPSQPLPAAPSDRSARESQPLLLEGLTEGGHYRIRARPAASPVTLHQMHDWIVGIELTGPSSEVPTALRFDGGMPAHGHGFVTRPRVTRNLGGGEFLVEGVKFHMPGAWVLQITVVGRTGSDRVTLPLTIDP